MSFSASLFCMAGAFGLSAVIIPNTSNAQEGNQPPNVDFEKPDVQGLQKQINDLKAKVGRLINRGDGENANGGDTQNNGFSLDWNPGPVLSSNDGQFSFQTNGRVTYDYSIINFEDGTGLARPTDKIKGINLRHLEFGFRGKFFGDFNYRIVTKFVNNEVELKLAYVDYRVGNTTIVAGQTRTYNTLDKLTPPPNHGFAERAAFINALRINPRVGVGVSHHGDNWSVSGGYFFEDASNDLAPQDDNDVTSGRVAFSPRFENGIGIHLGGSVFYRNHKGGSFDNRYRTRPFARQGDLRPLSSQILNVTSEMFYGGEFVATYKSFSVQAEYGSVNNKLSDMEVLTATDPSYAGGYVEVSFFPTGAERIIDGTDGRFNGVEIDKPVGDGGLGEVRLAARYDIADFTHEIFGRKQTSYILAADWYLNSALKLQANYAHSIVRNALNIKTDIIDTFNLRFMFNF